MVAPNLPRGVGFSIRTELGRSETRCEPDALRGIDVGIGRSIVLPVDSVESLDDSARRRVDSK